MNKDLLDLIPAEEQPVASKLTALVEQMGPSQAFQWELENQLLENASSTPPASGWHMKFWLPIGWVIAAIAGMLLLNEVIRSLAPQLPPAAGVTARQAASFAEEVRTGNICTDPLALGHGFSVFLSNAEKTRFLAIDTRNDIGELHSFTWSPDGERLAIVANLRGSGNIYITEPTGGSLEYLLFGSRLGYLRDATWSQDGKQLAIWSSQKNKMLYLLNADGNGLVEKRLGNVQIAGAPQFWPDGRSVVFYGATATEAGLFELRLTDSEATLINSSVEGMGSYAFSPDGSRLAYMEYNRDSGKALLYSLHLTTRERVILGSLPIPKGSGSSLPDTANLGWSTDGRFLVFDFGRNALDRAVYLAHTDGTGMIQVTDLAYAPSISADGKCLAYIRKGQVMLLDMSSLSRNAAAPTSIVLSELPTGRGVANSKQDKLQWSPKKE